MTEEGTGRKTRWLALHGPGGSGGRAPAARLGGATGAGLGEESLLGAGVRGSSVSDATVCGKGEGGRPRLPGGMWPAAPPAVATQL